MCVPRSVSRCRDVSRSERRVILLGARGGTKRRGGCCSSDCCWLDRFLTMFDGVILETSGVGVWSPGLESPATGNALEKGIGPSTRAMQAPCPGPPEPQGLDAVRPDRVCHSTTAHQEATSLLRPGEPKSRVDDDFFVPNPRLCALLEDVTSSRRRGCGRLLGLMLA